MARYAERDESYDLLNHYLQEIARIPRLTPEREKELGRRVQENDKGALEELVKANLRFVVSYAKRYRNAHVLFLDLINEGNIGLIHAAKKYDPEKNVKFITYAVWWVREAVAHVLAEQTRAFSFPPKQFSALYRGPGGGPDVSLSEPVGVGRFPNNGASRELGDLIEQHGVTPIEEEMIHRADVEELVAALGDLSGKEREVVCLRFGLEDDEPHTLQEIGDRLHLSRERVRQIESQAKEKLRRSARLRSHLN
jgi:RNA polymerase primary sigma factor